MANSIGGHSNDKATSLEWLHIDDFTPGCYDTSYVSTAEPIIPAPLGAASAEATFCCSALPQGGLGPLPKLAQVFLYSETFPPAVTTLFVVGMIVNPGLQDGKTEIIVILEGNGTTHHVIAYSYLPTTAAVHLITGPTITSGPVTGIFGAPYPAWTRGRVSTPTKKAGSPVLVFPTAVSTDTHGNSGHLWVYPTPTNPTTFSAKDLIIPTHTPSTGITGQVVCFFNRIIVLAGTDYTWPTGGGISTNENIDYTTPPNGFTLLDQNTVFAAEFPWGYGAAGSISTSELLLVKKQGGGVVVNGDVFEPSSVLYLPGIQPTGDFYGHPGASDEGLFYCCDGLGAYLWNGGYASQKISNQLRDDFFDCFTNVIESNNYGYFAQRWGELMLFSNNYVYNTLTGSWWVLYPNEANGTMAVPGRTFFHWSPGVRGYQMWAAPLRIGTAGGGGLGWLYRFDNRFPAPHWQWQSLPIHVIPRGDHVVDVRQVVVRASSPSAGSTVKVTIGSFTATSATAIGTTPTPLRFNVGTGALGLDDIVIRVNGDQSTTTTSSPIIHSIDVGYRTRAHIPAQH